MIKKFLGRALKKYKSWKYRNSSMDKTANALFIEKVNGTPFVNEGSCLNYLRDKRILLSRLGTKCGRHYLDLSSSDFDAFKSFISKYPKFVVKPIDLANGRGIRIIDLSTQNFLPEVLYQELISEDTLLLEEAIIQEDSLSKIYPYAVATIRLCTLRIGENVEIVGFPLLRLGSNGECTNNSSAIICRLDIDSGKVCGYPFSQINRKPISDYKHPDTLFSLRNFEVPFFNEAKQCALSAAELLPEVNFIGWDVAITNDGAVIIEGNGAPCSFLDEQMFLLQEKNIGIRPYYNSLLQYFNIGRNSDNPVVSKVNSILFEKMPKTFDKPDYVLILGSKNCIYKVDKALAFYASYSDVVYVASGGNLTGDKLECDVIKEQLVSNGIPSSNVICDKDAKNTYENLKNSFKLIMKHSKAIGIKNLKVSIITGAFHRKRVFDMLAKFRLTKNIKINIIPAEGSVTAENNWFTSFKGFMFIKEEFCKVIEKSVFDEIFPEEF